MFNRTVIKGLSVSAIALSTLIAGIQNAWAGKGNFWISNDSSRYVTELYITESFYDYWGNDITGPGVLGSGMDMQISFNNPSANVCYYDIRAEFSNGTVLEDFGVNVCSNNVYTFFDY